MFIPFGTDRNPRKSPLVTPIIVVLNTMAFALVFVLAKETGRDVSGIIDLGAFDTREPLRIWTYVSCLFLHDPGDVFHVLFNMLFLWVFGCAVEDRMGRIGFAIFYLFKQSRRRAAMRKAVGNTAAGPWSSATADTPARLATMRKRKPTPEEPQEIRDARTEISRLLREHESVRAATCYADVLKKHPKFILSVEQQLDVASTLYSEGRFAESAKAYEFYLERFKSDRRHRDTALLLTVLYVRKNRNPERARELIDELEPALTDDAHRRLLQTLREELDS